VFASSCLCDLVSDLSSTLINVGSDRTDEEIWKTLRRISELFDAPCCTLYKVRADETRFELVQPATAAKAAPRHAAFDAQKFFPWLFCTVVRNKNSLCLRSLDDLPAAAQKDRACLVNWGVRSALLIPVPSAAITYVFALASIRVEQAWSQVDIQQLRLLAEILVTAMNRRSAQQALAGARRELIETHRICGIGTWEWDLASDVVASEALDRILGVKLNTQAQFMELVHPSDQHALQNAFELVVANDGEQALIEYRIRTRRNDMRIVRSRFELVHADGADRVVGTVHDVTDARRCEQELQLLRGQQWHADRVASTGLLVASLAHELCQPLTAILSNAQAGLQFLSHEHADLEQIRDILTDIVADNKRASEVIDALRTMMRRGQRTRVSVDVAKLVCAVVALLHSEFVTRRVEVELACEDECVVLADEPQLEQVLLNLILNGIQSMQAQPVDQRHLHIQVCHMGQGEIQVAVRDSGVGIPADHINSVFDAFWTTTAHGLGMGLAVCRSIIEAHHGRIWVERNRDRGVSFLFRLPMTGAAS
jgi:signal transduction histidine kinase